MTNEQHLKAALGIYDHWLSNHRSLLNTSFPPDMLAQVAVKTWCESNNADWSESDKCAVVAELVHGIRLIRKEIL